MTSVETYEAHARGVWRAYQPVSPFGPVSGVALTFVLILIYFVLSSAYPVIALLTGAMDLKTLAAGFRNMTTAQLGWIVLSLLAAQAITFGVAYAFAGFKRHRRADVLALGAARRGILDYVLSSVGFFLVALLGGLLISLVLPHDELKDMRALLPLIFSDWFWLVAVAIAIGAPLCEEFVFRGFLFPTIAKTKIGVIGAALISSALWSLIHIYSIQGMLAIFLLGLALSAILVRTGSLWPCIVCHGLYNGAVLAYARVYLSATA